MTHWRQTSTGRVHVLFETKTLLKVVSRVGRVTCVMTGLAKNVNMSACVDTGEKKSSLNSYIIKILTIHLICLAAVRH